MLYYRKVSSILNACFKFPLWPLYIIISITIILMHQIPIFTLQLLLNVGTLGISLYPIGLLKVLRHCLKVPHIIRLLIFFKSLSYQEKFKQMAFHLKNDYFSQFELVEVLYTGLNSDLAVSKAEWWLPLWWCNYLYSSEVFILLLKSNKKLNGVAIHVFLSQFYFGQLWNFRIF